jgi:hypothetical protein
MRHGIAYSPSCLRCRCCNRTCFRVLALPPPLQSFLPFLAFFAALGCHGETVLSNVPRPVPAKRGTCYRINSAGHILSVRPKQRLGVLSCMDDTLGRDVMANRRQR